MSPELRLVTAAANGDDAAYTRWLEDLRPQLIRYAADRLGGDRSEAEDVVQDASMRALLALRDGRVPANPRAWMYVIVRNRCHDVRSARRAVDPLDDAMGVHSHAPGPEELAASRRQFDAVVGALGALPESQRRVLVSATFEGRPYEEIAAREETSVQAVKSLVHRARRGLEASGARAASFIPGFAFLRDRMAGLGDQVTAMVSQHTAAVATGAAAVAVAVPVGVTTVEHHRPAPRSHQVATARHVPLQRVAPVTSAQPTQDIAAKRAVAPAEDRAAKLRASVPAVLAACRAGESLDGRFDASALSGAKSRLPTSDTEYGDGCTQRLNSALMRTASG